MILAVPSMLDQYATLLLYDNTFVSLEWRSLPLFSTAENAPLTVSALCPVVSLFFSPNDQNKARPFIAWAHSHTLRCVRFTPGGNGIIVGAANGSSVIPTSHTQNHVREGDRDRDVAGRGGVR